MTTIATSLPAAPIIDTAASSAGTPGSAGIVEVNLLLPGEWAQDLMELARQRRQSVGQIIRSMIGHALQEQGDCL